MMKGKKNILFRFQLIFKNRINIREIQKQKHENINASAKNTKKKIVVLFRQRKHEIRDQQNKKKRKIAEGKFQKITPTKEKWGEEREIKETIKKNFLEQAEFSGKKKQN